MQSSFARHLDALASWRHSLDRQLAELVRTLRGHGLLDAAVADALEALRRQVSADRLVLAFVAEFSRGKTELVNAIFFADTGRRILPATPGRTTMCPVEIGYQRGEAALLALLPIDTRTMPQSLDELRRAPDLWTRIPLDTESPERLADALTELMRTKAVTVDEARNLGLWDDERSEDNPPQVSAGLVEVPSWRHAVVNYPHPLLERGLVLLDTPGLNAIGAEAALTLGLLPAAHAAVFVVGADTGVTRSDLAIWREHLAAQTMTRYVVLNKIDTLADPLMSPPEVEAQVERQRAATAAALGVEPQQVYALSARKALLARIDGQRLALAESRLPAFEDMLAGELLPQRRQVLERALLEVLEPLEQQITRQLQDHRRQTAEQLLELRGLRGKSQAKVQLMLERVAADATDFERCSVRLTALRAVHSRMLRSTLHALSIDRLRDEVARLQHEIASTLFRLGARRLFGELCQRLRERVVVAARRNEEIRTMLQASFTRLNSEFGFALQLPDTPSLEATLHELDLIERNIGGFLGLTQALRLADPRYLEQVRRMMWSRLRALFEAAIAQLEQWNRAASAQIDTQLRERREGYARRRDGLGRIQGAAGELEQRIAEVEAQDQKQRRVLAQVQGLFGAVREQAQRSPDPDVAQRPLRAEPPTLTLVVPRAGAGAS
jgi:hypothetical protein